MRLPALLGGLRHGEPSVILSVLGRDIPHGGSWHSPVPEARCALAPKRERMALVLGRKRSYASASSYPRPAAGAAGMYLTRSNASRGRKKA